MPEDVLETPQPVQPTESKSTDWTKIILAAILGLGLLVGAAYGGYYYGTQQVQPAKEPNPVSKPTLEPTPTPTPTPTVGDETTGWKNYTNGKFGVSFKYPKNFSVNEERAYREAPPSPTFLTGVAVYWEGDDPLMRRWLRILNPEEDVGGTRKQRNEEFLKLKVGESYRYRVGATDVYETATRLEDQTIGGIEATVYEIPKAWEIEGPIRVMLIHKGDTLYTIYMTYSNRDGRNINYPKTFDQILSTFKFLD